MASMHGEYRSFPSLDAFSRVFPAKKPYNTAPKWRNVRFVSEFVHTLPGGPHCPSPHGPKSWGHLMHASTCTMYKQDHSGLPEGRSESGLCVTFFSFLKSGILCPISRSKYLWSKNSIGLIPCIYSSLRSHKMIPNLSRNLRWPWHACMTSILHFRHSMHV